MAQYPHAVQDLVSGRSAKGNVPVRMIAHTAWTDSPDIYGPGKGPGLSYAHFYNPTDGAMRQHQDIERMAYAETARGSFGNVSVEHQDERRDMPMSENQLDNDARLFAYLVKNYDVPNRIATPDDTRGLAWHRLGVSGNFGRYDRNDPTTWSRAQTGMYWSGSLGKTCPTDPRIRQIPEIWRRAQTYLTNPKDDPEDDMPSAEEIAREVWRYELDELEIDGVKIAAENAGTRLNWNRKYAVQQARRAKESLILVRGYETALDALAKSKGADSDAIVAEVREALKGLEATVTLTTED